MTTAPGVVFDRVWKKFRRGERHDSLRDVVPAALRRLFRARPADAMEAEEFWALRDVSFEVGPGEALGIIGPNGAGKSTALKLLTRILRPTLGRCEVRGRAGALIELAAGFHPDLTGRENMYLQGAIMGLSRPDVARRFDAIVAFSGVEAFIDTQVKRYSSGMQARLGFAIAAHLEPDVLLIDEVLAVGDFTFQQKCYERLEAFRQSGMPLVLVSHNLQAIAKVCNRALLLRQGQPPVLGSTSDIISLWTTLDGQSADPRAALVEARLSLASGGNVPETISPGTPLRLDVVCTIAEHLPRCGVAVQVIKGDGHEVFLGASNDQSSDGLDLVAGQRLEASVVLQPHVLRGIYRIHVLLVDSMLLWRRVEFTNVASFVVSETARNWGCVDFYPQFRLKASEGRDVVRAH